jgi:hypothetical protein
METNEIELTEIEPKIYLIRGHKVMLDHDLAELYQETTKRLNQQVTRNLKRFPRDFMFPLTDQEVRNLKLQFATSSLEWGGRRKPTQAFTEQGIAMLSTVLRSERAIDVNIAIMRTFVRLRHVLNSNKELEKKIMELETRFEGKFKVVFDAIKKVTSQEPIPRKRIIGLAPEE